MAKFCQICKKRGMLVVKRKKLRGKYNPTIKRRKKPNLQWVLIPKEIEKKKFRKFAGKRILACTKCIKAMAKRK